MNPGINNQTFKIHLKDNHFQKNDIFFSGSHNLKVIKSYRVRWWKSLLSWLGIKKNWFIGIKAKILYGI